MSKIRAFIESVPMNQRRAIEFRFVQDPNARLYVEMGMSAEGLYGMKTATKKYTVTARKELNLQYDMVCIRAYKNNYIESHVITNCPAFEGVNRGSIERLIKEKGKALIDQAVQERSGLLQRIVSVVSEFLELMVT